MKLFAQPLVFAAAMIFAFSAQNNFGQGTVYWRNTAANGNWANDDGSNINNWYRSTPNGWDVRRGDLGDGQWSATGTKAYNIFIFDNGTQATTTVNAIGGAQHLVYRLLLRNNTDRTFNATDGGNIKLGGGSEDAKIETEAGATGTYTFNVPMELAKTTEISAVNGNMVFNSGSTINTAGNILESHTASGKQVEFKGVISGASGQFQHKGAGLVILEAANTYSGATTVEAAGGVVQIQNASALGSGSSTTVSSGAALETYGNLGTVSEALTINGTGVSSGGSLRNVSGSSTWSGAITLGSASRINSDSGTLTIDPTSGSAITGDFGLTFGGSGNVTVNDPIAIGANTVTKDGTGLLTLAGANTYTGTTIINAGTISVSAESGLGTIPTSTTATQLQFGGGTLAITTGFTMDSKRGITLNTGGGTIEVASSQTLTYGGIITGGNAFTKTGSGGLTLSGVNTYTGTTTVNAGTITLGAAGVIADSSNLSVSSGATFALANNNETVGSVSGAGNITLGSAILTSSATANSTFSGVISGSGAFTKAGSGNLTLGGVNTYTGLTTVSAGTITLSGSGGIAGDLTVSSGATFDLGGTSETLGSVTGEGSIALGSGTLTTDSGATTTFSGVISGSGALVKNGAGTLTLSGSSANTFSGTTTVNNGVLILAKTGGNVNALAGTPTINSGGILRLEAGNQFNGDSTFLTINSGGIFEMNGFDDTLAFQGAGTVDLGSGTLTMNPGLTDTFSGKITGSGGLIKANAGTQILSGAASDYTGTTTVNSGYIEIQSASALGASGANQGTTVNSGGQLRLNHTTGMTVAESISLNGLGVSGDQSGVLKNTGGANTISGAVTLAGGSRIQVTAGSLNLSGSVSAGANSLYLGGTQALTISGNLSGTKTTGDMAVLIDNTGTTTFSGADNTGLTGNVRVNANGTVLLGSENALGGGVLTFAPSTVATIASTGGSARNVGNSTTYIYGTGLNLGVANTGTGSLTFGAVSLGNDATGSNQRTITTAAGSSHTFGAVAGGVNNTLIKSGSGTLILSGASSSTGGIQLNDGTLMVGNNSALGTGTLQIDYNSNTGSRTIASSGEGAFSLDNNVNLYFNELTLGQSSGGTGSLTIGSSGKTFALGSDGSALTRQITVNGEHTIASVITGGNNNKLGVGGSGRLTLTGPNTFSGGVSLNGTGQLRLNSATAAGTGSISQSDGNSTLEINTTGTVANEMSIYNVKTLQTVTLSGNKTLNNATYDVAADTTTTESGLLSGNGGVTKKGAGELILGNTANSFTNIVDIQNGTLTASTIANSNSTSTIGQGPEVKISSSSTAGTFKYTGGTAGMNRTVTVGSAGGTISVNDSAATMTLNGTVAGSGNTLTKTGAGALAFGSGASVSLGTIAVQQGTLLLGAANQLGATTNAASSLNLSAGTTLKTASDLAGNVLTLAGTSAQADTIFDFDTAAGNDFTFGSTTWYGGNLKLSNVAVGTVVNFGAFSGNSGLTFNDFQSKVSFTDTGLQAQINFSGTSLTVAAIPEPKVYMAAGALALLIGYAEVRRRKKIVSSKA